MDVRDEKKKKKKLLIILLAIFAVAGVITGLILMPQKEATSDNDNVETGQKDEDKVEPPKAEDDVNNPLDVAGTPDLILHAGPASYGTKGLTVRHTIGSDEIFSTTPLEDIMNVNFFRVGGISTRSPHESGDYVLDAIADANAVNNWGSYLYLKINKTSEQYLRIVQFKCSGGLSVKPKIDKTIADLIVASTADKFSIEGSVEWNPIVTLREGKWTSLTVTFSDGAKHNIDICE